MMKKRIKIKNLRCAAAPALLVQRQLGQPATGWTSAVGLGRPGPNYWVATV